MTLRIRTLCGGLLATLLLLIPDLQPAHAQSFTLEQVLSFGFPSDLTASPDGNRIAWLENREGLRNVWVAQGPE